MNTYILKNICSDIPTYRIVDEDYFYNHIKSIGYDVEVYKISNYTLTDDKNKNNVFKFNGVKCKIIDATFLVCSLSNYSIFDAYNTSCKTIISESEILNNKQTKELFDYIKQEKFRKHVTINKFYKRRFFIGKKEPYYEFNFNKLILMPTNKKINEITSTYVINYN